MSRYFSSAHQLDFFRFLDIFHYIFIQSKIRITNDHECNYNYYNSYVKFFQIHKSSVLSEEEILAKEKLKTIKILKNRNFLNNGIYQNILMWRKQE